MVQSNQEWRVEDLRGWVLSIRSRWCGLLD